MGLRNVVTCLLFSGISHFGSVLWAVEPLPVQRDPFGGASVDAPSPRQSTNPPVRKKSSPPTKIIRYAQHIIAKYDVNRDRVLQKEEWKAMHGRPELIDRNGDNVISSDELADWIAEYDQRKRDGFPLEPDSIRERPSQIQAVSPEPDKPVSVVEPVEGLPLETNKRSTEKKFFVPANRLPSSLPDWFFERDTDGDGQLTVVEYCTTGGAQERADFDRLDANGDGVVTAKECVRKPVDKPATVKASADGLPSAASEKPSRSRRKPQSSR